MSIAVAAVVHPFFREAGGATKFFADAMILGFHVVVLTGVYYAARPRAVAA